jgi:hypothetical protein
MKIADTNAGWSGNMDAAYFPSMDSSQALLADPMPERIVTADEFRKLLVSHRRMIRVDRRDARQKGLQDLDTGEVFLTDERRLVDVPR